MALRARSLWSLTVLLAGLAAAACEGDPPKRAVYESDGGEGGAPEVPGTAAGAPGADAGAPSQGGMPASNVGGMPSSDGGVPSSQGGMPGSDGGMSADAGTANQPTAGAPNNPACEGVLTFADPYVEDSVLTALGLDAGPITSAMVSNLTELTIWFNDDEIDMNGIECLTALESVYFGDGADPQPRALLAQLPNLRSLDYHDGYLTDLVGLEQVTQLTSLDVSANHIRDFGPLQALVNLEHLNIGGNNDFSSLPVEISSLESLTKLQSLDANYLIIDDFSFLAALPDLVELGLGWTGLTAIPDLSEMDELTALGLAGNALTSFTPLETMTGLSRLDLGSTGLSSLTSIAPLTGLTDLNVAGNALTDITVLGALPQLSVLDISYNGGIVSLQPLVASSYIGSGDTIDYEALYDCDVFGDDVDTLIARGVVMEDYCQ